MKKTLLKTFILFAFTNLYAQDITTDLVFNLSCDSSVNITDGETLSELSSSTATGTIVGEIETIEGPNGTANSAFNFSSASHINFAPADIANLPIGDISEDGRSYALWIKTEIGDTRMQIFGYGNNTTAEHVHLNLNQVTTNPGQLNLGHWQRETTQNVDNISAITDNNWHHIVAVITKTTDGYSTDYYVDGQLTDTKELVTTNVINTTIETGTDYSDFRIGGRNSNPDNGIIPFTGGLDDIRLYNRVLTAVDVEALYLTKGNTLAVVSTVEKIESFKVFPTVTSDILNIQSNVNIKQLSIVNINGVTVKNIKPNTTETEINVSNLSNGLYFIVGESESSTSTSKFIKK